MDAIRLQIENFCRHSNSDIVFSDFSSAIIVGKIKGSEKFSNGVGKSTIFSAIKYVLFNEVESSTLDKIIRHNTDSCKVVFDFRSALDGEVYRISRSRGRRTGSEVRLYKNVGDVWEDITQRRNPDTEKEIAKIVKINYKTFCNSTLFAQSDLAGLASLLPAARKLVLKEALQLNVYSKYEAAAKKKTSDLYKEIEKEKIILGTLGDPDKDITKFKDELDQTNTNLDIKNNYLNSIRINYDRENEKYIALTNNFETLEKQSAEFVTKQKSLQDESNKISDSIKDFRRRISSVKEVGQTLSVDIKQLSNSIDNMKNIALRDKELVRNDIDNSTQDLINKKASYSSQLSKLEELKIPLPTGTVCKYCRQTIVDRDECQAAIDAEILDKTSLLKIHKEELDILVIKCKNLNNELKTIESTEVKILAAQTSLSAKVEEVEAKRSLYSEYTELLDNNVKLLTTKNSELVSMKNIDNKDYSSLKQDLNDQKVKVTNLVTEIDYTNKSVVHYSNIKAVLTHKIEERIKDKTSIINIKNTICKLEEKYLIHQKVVQAFGSTGIPALITHTILDDFQVETNIWLSKLRPGLQLQFSVIKDRSDGDKEDTLNISYMLDGHDMEYPLLSGAQKFIVALSLKLGLASVIKKRLGVEMRLLLIDEVDQCLDEGTLEAFEDTIRQLQQDFKVLVITHNNELKAKFSHAILVEQDENFASKAKVVNTW